VPRQVFRYDKPERFVAGTVGEPGQRTFFLQARSGGRLTSVALEKEQVVRLAEGLDALLDEVIRQTGGDPVVPAVAPSELDDKDPLDQPIEEEFRVGKMTIAWDANDRCAVIEAFSLTGSDEEELAAEEPTDEKPEDDERSLLVVRLSGAEARAFVKRALAVVRAGRPSCPWCGQPVDPEGHICPRQDGYRRRG
jgi:uncharacterized repeat protein (TIGR03847 family)